MYEDGLCPICHENLGWLAERFWFYGVPPDIAHYQHIHNLGLLFPASWGEWDRIRRIYGWFVKLALTTPRLLLFGVNAIIRVGAYYAIWSSKN